ncbi:MAG: S8 family serine peptidase [Bacteroidota bacterium]|nr:S8 family serine peptidase [Bacteroidota bacterium]
MLRLHKINFFLICFALTIPVQLFGKSSNNNGNSVSAIQHNNVLPGVVVVKFRSAADPAVQSTLRKFGVVQSLSQLTQHDPYFQKFPGAKIVQAFPKSAAEAAAKEVGLDRIHYYTFSYALDPAAVAKEISKSPLVEYAEPHYIYREEKIATNDPDYSKQYYLTQIKADAAWNTTTGDSSVIIGIVDSGVDWKHPDLLPNIHINPKEDINGNGKFDNYPSTQTINGVTGDNNGIDDDQNGYIDDVIGWDFAGANFTPDNNPTPGNEHGTHVAGIAAAKGNNGIGIAGVAYNCRILSVKAGLDSDSQGLIYYGYEGIQYAAENGASVINCSWGGTDYSQYGQDIIQYATAKGALVVAAAGNENVSTPHYPSDYPGVLSVASVSSSDTKSYFSNFGFRIDASAPGENIYSTLPNNSYNYLSGTSMASPMAAGVAALVKSVHPDWTADQVREQVRVSADNIDNLNSGYTQQLGFGRIDAERAVTLTSPGVALVSFTASDSALGNGNGSLELGEKIQLFCAFENYLAPGVNLTITLSSKSPYVTILDSSIQVGALGELQSANNNSHPFVFQISASTPANYVATLVCDIHDGNGTYDDYAPLRLLLNATYRDANVGTVALTFNGRGNLGFDDYPNNIVGDGFFNKLTQTNLLFEGAFMAGVSDVKLVDVARDSTGNEQDSDFVATAPLSVFSPGSRSDQEIVSQFSDAIAGSHSLGISVTTQGFAFKNPPFNNGVIIRYRITNSSGASLSGLYCGTFFDWDVGSASNNIAQYDAAHNLGYVYDVTKTDSTYAGVAILSGDGSPQFHAINNADTGTVWGIYDGFSRAEKWDALHNGISKASAGVGDVSFVIGTGPATLASGDSTTFTIAVMASPTLSDLISSVTTAQQRWSYVSAAPSAPTDAPLVFALGQNYPNPFNPTTQLRFTIAELRFVTLKIYDVLGREVATLVNEQKSPGTYAVNFDGSRFASGVYFYHLQAGSFIATKRMVLVK